MPSRDSSRAVVAHFLLATLVLGLVPPPPAMAKPSAPQIFVSAAELERSSPILKKVTGNRAAAALERSEGLVTVPALPGAPPRPKAAEASSPDVARSLLRPADAPPPEPGIQRTPLPKERMLYKEVEPPRSPFDAVKYFPNEYLPPGVAFPPPGSQPVAKLHVRPGELRFALTPGGALPAEQTLEVTSDSRRGVGFEIVDLPDWLAAGHRRGRASFDPSVIELSVLERHAGEPTQGEVVLRNADDPEDVLRVPVHLSAFAPGEPIEPLGSYDEDGRLERLVRADGTVIDYEYDEYGQLTRVRYPDGTSVGYTYDDDGHRTSMVDSQGTTVYRYDEKGRLTAVYSPGFDPVRYKWDDEDRLVALTYPHGRVVSYTYDEAGRLASVHEDAGTTVYRYGEDGRLLGQTLPNGIATDYGYDVDGRIVDVEHRNAEGELVLGFRYELDEEGRTTRMERETVSGIEVSSYAYDEEGRVTWTEDPDGRSVSYEYDELGNRLRTTESHGDDVVVTDYYYDEAGRLVQVGDETLEYDVHGNVVTRRSPERTVEYGYDFENRLVSYRDGEHEVVYGYDGDGERVATSAQGRQTLYRRDFSGYLGEILFEGSEKEITRAYTYGLERIGMTNNGEGQEIFLYDRPLHNVAATTTTSGDLTASYTYDVLGVPRPAPRGPLFLFGGETYDPVTRLTYTHLGHYYDAHLGILLSQQYNDDRWLPGQFSNQLAQAVGMARVAATAEDPGENSQTPKDTPPPRQGASDQVHVWQLNQLPEDVARNKSSRPRRTSFPELTQFKRGRGYQRHTTRKEASEPRIKVHPEYLIFSKTNIGLYPTSQTIELSAIQPQSISIALTEDIPWLSVSTTSGLLTGTPLVITASVDPTGLDSTGSPYSGKLTVTDAGTGEELRSIDVRMLVQDVQASPYLKSFDSRGNLQRLVKPDGSILDHEYDDLGRLVKVRYPDNSTVLYTYDRNGNRTTMTDHRGTTIYQYDSQGRLISDYQATEAGSNALVPVHYAYDDSGNLISMEYPGGRTISYTYNGDNQLISVSDGQYMTEYQYDPVSGLLMSQSLPNGLSAIFTHNSDGHLTGVAYLSSTGASVLGFSYALNAMGLRTSVTRSTASASETTSYEYDDLQRLSKVTYADGRTVDYGYDELGNRTSAMDSVDGQTDYSYDSANRILSAGGEIFQHDLNGNLIRRVSVDRTIEYTYDYDDYLVKVESEGLTVDYEYDGDHNRVAKIVNGRRTNYVNSSGGFMAQVLVEATADWTLQRQFIYGLTRIGQLDSSAADAFYLYNDEAGGDVAALYDELASPLATYQYDAFGTPSPAGSAEAGDYLYAGERYDTEVGLVDLRGRSYDPALGRFLQRDPLGLIGDLNPYVYARNNPINYLDRTGLRSESEIYPPGWTQTDYNDSPNWVRDDVFDRMHRPNTGSYRERTGYFPWEWSERGQITFHEDGSYETSTDLIGTHGPMFDGGWAIFGHPGTLFLPIPWALHGVTDLLPAVVKESYSGIKSWLSGEPNNDNILGNLSSSSNSWDVRSSTAPFSGPFSGGDLGGVSLNKTADLLLQVDNITGATYDDNTGQIILFGEQDVSLPEMDLDDMAVATNSIYHGEDPGVSIDPPIQNGQMSVRYEGETISTEFGWIMFEADRVLKILSLGKDNLTGQPVTSSVPGYKSMLARRIAAGCNSLPEWTRMWFQPREVRLVRSADGQTMLFDEVSMELLYESKIGDQVVSDPDAAAFAQHFTDNYDLFAAEWPILRQLERLGRVVAVMKWIKDNEIPIDLSFIENYDIEFFSTPVATPVTSASGSTGSCTITLTGGVTYRPPNDYLSDDPIDPVTSAVRDEALGSRPSDTDFLWGFQPPQSLSQLSEKTSSTPLTAIAQSFTRSRKEGNVRFQEVDLSYPSLGEFDLELSRFYDSFDDRTGPLGPGWQIAPFALRFPVGKESFTFGPENLAYDLYARIWVAERWGGREDEYALLGIDDEDLPLYVHSGTMDLIHQESDDRFRLTKVDGTQIIFDLAGRLLTVTDSNANILTYVYDSSKRLASIEDSRGMAINLGYNSQSRLGQASGPGGRQVTYGYDTSDRLVSVTNNAGKERIYAYDTDHHLISIIDAEGHVVFNGSYDDYNRTSSRRLGSSKDFSFDFDLQGRRAQVTDSLGLLTEQLFDEDYRLMQQTDPLGNRNRITYDGDFGPATLTNAEGTLTQLAYDSRGHLSSLLDAQGGELELFYDAFDHLVATRDPEGVETAFAYDAKGNLTTVYHSVELQFNETDDLVSFLYDPSNVTEFTHNSDGSLSSVTDPSGHTGSFGYDANGQLTSSTSPTGRTSSFTYDLRRRLGAANIGGRQAGFVYDDSDNLTAISTTAGQTEFAYDANGKMTQITGVLDNVVGFTYDADGNLTAVQDAAHQTTSYAYDVLGNLTAVDLPNGSRNEYEYDELGRPVVTFSGVGNPDPDLGVVTDSLDFGSVGLGDASALPLNLYNLASVPLTISDVTASAPFSTDFPGTTVIPPGNFLTVTVTFTPSAVGAATANLTITSNDPDDPSHLVALAGVGTVKVLGLTASPAGDGIELEWDPFDPGGEPFLHFNVFRSTSPIGDDVGGLTPIDESLTDANATSFVDRSAEPGASYYYAVTPEFTGYAPTAVDSVGPVAYFTAFDVLSSETALASSASDETRPAIAYNSTAGNYLVVFEKGSDILGQLVAADGTTVGSPFNVASKAVIERRPRLAYNSTANNYLVVFEEDYNGDGSNWVVNGQLVTSAGALSGSAFFVGGYLRHETNPEVAYNPTANDYLVVFEMDADAVADGKLDCVGQRINAAGAPLGSLFWVGGIAVNGTPVVDQNPHLVYNATGDEYLTAFEVDLNDDGSDFEIVGARYSGAGAPLSSPFLLGSTVHAVTGANLQDKNPYVGYDSGNNEYLTLWDVDVNGDGTNWSVASQKTYTSGAPITLLDGFLVVVDTAAQERNARQVYNPTADEHLLVWEESSAGDPRILARRYRLTDTSLLWGGVLEVASGTADLRQRPDGAFNSASNEMLVAWESDTGSGIDVVGSRLGNVAPVLGVSPPSLDFGTSTTELDLTVSNTGSGHLDWVVSRDEPWLSAVPASASTLTDETVTVSVDRTGLLPGVYNATLSVSSSGGNADVGVVMTVPNSPPDVPGSPQPADGSANQKAPDGSLDLTLSWQSSDANGDSLTYDLYFGTNAALVTAEDPSVRLRQGLTSASTMLSGLDFLTSYAWRVVASDSRGDSTSGPTWSFVTAAISAPQLFELLPDPTNLPRPVLSWQAVAGASGYELQIDDDPSFASPLVHQSGLVATSFTPSSDLPEGVLHWRVRSRDGNGVPGAYSAVDTFTADRTPPPVPSLVALVPDPTGDSRPLLSWNAAAGAASYRLQVDDQASFASPLVEVTVGATSHEPVSSLPEGTLYWRVASRDAAGNQSSYSAADSFTLDLTSPPPATGLAVTRSGGNALLAWDAFATPPADFDHWNVYRSSSSFTNVSGMTPLSSSLTNAYTDSTAVLGMAYYYAVTGVDTVGNENKSVVPVLLPGNFAPATPGAAIPADGAAGVLGADVGLSWQASDPEGAALTYDVYLSTDSARVAALDVTVRVAQDLTAAAWTASGLQFLTTYSWRVVAFDPLDAGTASPVWSFTVGVAAPALDAVSPLPQPTLTWQWVAGAVRYQIQVDDDPAFGSPLVNDSTVTSTSFVPPSPLPDGELHWRVRAFDAAGLPGPFSAAGTFTVDSTSVIFADGFESGNVTAWSSSAGGP